MNYGLCLLTHITKMGYYTNFNGKIELSKNIYSQILNYLIKNEIKPLDEIIDYINIEKNILYISGCSIKNYENYMEKVCDFITKLDNKAEGQIDCDGEEREDFWGIKLNNGKVTILRGIVTYEEDYEFEDNDIKKMATKIKRDKNIIKKIIVEVL